MRITTTAALAIITIILAVVIWGVDRDPGLGDEAAGRANVLVRFDPNLVDRVVVEKGQSKTLMEKRNGFWFFTEPEVDRIDAGLIAVLLDQFNHLTIVDRIDIEGGDLSPETIGVEGDNALKVTVEGPIEEDGKNRFQEVLIMGIEAPRAESMYVRNEIEGQTYVVDGNPRKWLERPTETLRDARLISAPAEGIVQLVVRNSTGEVALQRRITPPKQEWSISKPIQTWASREVMDQLLADLVALKIESVESGDSDEEIPSPLPDDAAVLQLQVFGVPIPLTLYIKQIEEPPVKGAPALVEVRISDRPAVFRLHSQILNKLPKTADDLRDRTLARIPMLYLDSIVIQSRIDPLVYLKSERQEEGIRWDVKVNNELLSANLNLVSKLVSGVNEAAIQDFSADDADHLEEFGLKPAARRVTFNLKFPGQPNQDGSAGPIQELQRSLNLGWKEGDEHRLFANFEGEPHVYELDPSFVSLIPTHPIKWRSLNVLTFNPFHLESITRDQPGGEKLKLDYEYRRDNWKALRNGVDVTPSLDISAARRLRDRLGALTARGRYLSLATAYEALEDPSVRFVIVTNEFDPEIGKARPKTYVINLAPSPAHNIYFGQIEGLPDVFYLDHETYRDLIRPVTTSRITNPK
tara:strand:+ start:88 stop:1998 length:1911 start_codon:yes stop_codon:yes gene_type:complete